MTDLLILATWLTVVSSWVWMLKVGIPRLIRGTQEVRDHWNDDGYWDNELHTLLLEESDHTDAWDELEWDSE